MANLPTIKQLRYFVALEHCGHFGKAAEICYISQPAFSVAIRELETILNLQLIDRTNKSVTITSIGQEIATQARLVIRDTEGLVEIAEGNQAPLCGQLRLGIIPTIAPFLLPVFLPRLRRVYPLLKLFLQEDQTKRVYAQLMEGTLDIILIALPYALRNTENMKLFKDPFNLAYHKDTKLFDPDTEGVDQLPDESILLMEDGHCLRDHALTACKIRNVNKISRITANSLLTLVQMVDADLGVTYLPEMAINSTILKHTRIMTKPIKAGGNRDIGLVWRKGSVRNSEFKLLGDFIKKNWQTSKRSINNRQSN